MSKRLQNLVRLGELRTICDKESDKGLALTMASLIELSIHEIIGSLLVDCETSHTYLKKTSLAPISIRAMLAQSLGLISKMEMDVIKEISGIRNDFAHNWKVDFNDPEIDRRIRVLSALWIKFDMNSNSKFKAMSNRDLFDTIAFMLLTDLTHRAEDVTHYRLKPVNWSRTWQNKMGR